MTQPQSGPAVTDEPAPRRGMLIATLVFVAAALTLCWPILSGQVLAGSDYQIAGWAFRSFGAEYWREHHAIPLWNPFIFGGMPFVAGMHGDIFYPTAWLRYFLPLDVATNLTFAGHLVIAGIAMYALLRRLGLSWTAAVTGGLAYELSGIVASLVHPGHDGKLFVSALAPFVFLGLLKGIRDGKASGYAAAALAIGLAFHGHPQMSYYLLVAAGIWALFLTFDSAAGPRGRERVRALAWSAGAVALGLGIYAIQLLPFYAYIPYSPRVETGPSGGWEYATQFAMAPVELWTTFLPELNGVLRSYAGPNFFKLHTEYLGAIVVLLAICGLGNRRARRERIALGVIALLFLFVAFGAATPFYRLWYELMPMMKNVRAAGMAFYLVALPVCVFAAFGVDRIRKAEVSARFLLIGAGGLTLLGLFGAVGGLDGLAQALALPQLQERTIASAPALHAGALRLFIIAAIGGGILLGIRARKLSGAGAAVALFILVTADLWSVDRKFFVFDGTAEALFGDDELTATLRRTPLPYRVWDPKGEKYGDLGVYQGSWLMGRGVPQLLGYHGNELRYFDEAMGVKNVWKNQVNLGLLELFAVRYIVARDTIRVPGFSKAMGPVSTRHGPAAYLYQADTVPPYVRLMAGAVKAPDAQVAEVVADPRFPVLAVAIYADSEKVSPAPLGNQLPTPAAASASVAAWEPGKMRFTIEGRDERPLYLVVAENWYKDWRATVDGAPAPVLRAQHTLLSVTVPPGAKEVAFEFRSLEYERGRLISLLSLTIVAGLFIASRVRRKNVADA